MDFTSSSSISVIINDTACLSPKFLGSSPLETAKIWRETGGFILKSNILFSSRPAQSILSRSAQSLQNFLRPVYSISQSVVFLSRPMHFLVVAPRSLFNLASAVFSISPCPLLSLAPRSPSLSPSRLFFFAPRSLLSLALSCSLFNLDPRSHFSFPPCPVISLSRSAQSILSPRAVFSFSLHPFFSLSHF